MAHVTSRRHVLRGALATLALPFLPSALPRAARAADPAEPRRLLWWFMPNGMLMEAFTPSAEGTGFPLSMTLEPLEDLKDRMLVISGLENSAALAQPTAGCVHEVGTATILTDAGIDIQAIRAGTSVDQVAANALGQDTPFPSLQLTSGEESQFCVQNQCIFYDTVSWASATTPLTPLGKPLVLFERMFGNAGATLTEEEAARRVVMRTSVLDAVDLRSRSLLQRLGAADELRLDEYLTGVRELEARIQLLAMSQCASPEVPPPNPGFQQTTQLMTDLMVKAFECDLTRVITYMVGPSVATTSYAFLGVNSQHHTISHYAINNALKSSLVTIQQWGIDRLGDVARALAEKRAADGSSLLDHCMLMLATDMEDPNYHRFNDMPALVLGGEAGGVATGRHMRVPRQPISNLWRSALEFAGHGDLSFGQFNTGPIDLS